MGIKFSEEEQVLKIEELNKEIQKYNGIFVIDSYFINTEKRNSTYYNLFCTVCHKTWQAKKCDIEKIIRNQGVGCYSCNRTAINNKRYANSNVNLYRKDILNFFEYDNIYNKFTCKTCGHSFISSYSEITKKYLTLNKSNPCAYCGGQRNYRLQQIKEDHIKNIKQIPNLIYLNFVDYKNKKLLYVRCLCKQCGHDFEKRIQEIYDIYTRNGTNACPNCYNPHSGTSQSEQSLKDYILSLNVKINPRYRLNNKEIDIYIPGSNIGFELNGGFYHSDRFKELDYHKNKTDFFTQNNIRIYHIFSFEWEYKRDIIKTIINNALNLEKKQNIRSQDYEVMKINWLMAKSFLDQYHIMGHGNPTSRCYGLFYKNTLQAVATFTHPRKRTVIQKLDNIFEFHRFASKARCYNALQNIIKQFQLDEQVNKIITFVDLRFSTYNNLYANAGFKYIEDTKPSYWWYKNDNNYFRRYETQKHLLIKKFGDSVINKTEEEIMTEQGYLKVYDCGHAKYELEL